MQYDKVGNTLDKQYSCKQPIIPDELSLIAKALALPLSLGELSGAPL